MKRTTFTHHKLVDLANALDITDAHAAGTLGFLWYATAEYADEGDIGRFTDAKIAWFCRWKGDPKILVDALVKTLWVDRVDGPARLLIHDWPDHCEDTTHAKLARKRAFFANKRAPSLRALRSDERDEAAKWYAENTPHGPTKPPQTPRKRSKGRKQAEDNPHATPGTVHASPGTVHTSKSGALAQPSPARASPSHALPSQSPQPQNPTPEPAAPPSGWLAGQDPAAMLAAIPVREPALSHLVAGGATCDRIKSEWIGVKSEQLRGSKIANPEAVFINRMCRALGINAPKRAGIARTTSVGAAMSSVFTPGQMARIDAARRHTSSG